MLTPHVHTTMFFDKIVETSSKDIHLPRLEAFEKAQEASADHRKAEEHAKELQSRPSTI